MDSRLQHRKYDVQVHDAQYARMSPSDDSVISTGCLTFVYTAGTKTLATIFSDEIGTALANPIARSQFNTDGKIRFWGAAASYDIVVNDDRGNTGIYPGVAPTLHRVSLTRSGAEKCLVFPMVFNAGGTVVDTGLDLPGEVVVHDVRVEVTTIDATETVDVGLLATETGGDEDGFVAAASVATAGFPAMRTITVGSSESFLSAFRVGALLGSLRVGVDTAGREGQLAVLGHVVTGANAKSITYTPSSSDTFAGYGYVYFRHIR